MDELISRQAAIDAVSGGMCSGWDCDVIDKLKALPSVQPKERCIANITLNEEDLERIVKEQVEEIKELLPQKGEWIDYSSEGFVECPFCHSATNCDDNKDELHYCFSCGAELR